MIKVLLALKIDETETSDIIIKRGSCNHNQFTQAQADAQKMVEEAKREVAQEIFCELSQVKCSDCPLTNKERKSDINSICNYEYSCPHIIDGKTYDEVQQNYLGGKIK
jgi:hypothetical protein